ncbi:protein of unknown function [Trichlorobacter ammonificans]|uniref:Uncharacterized protein n=1 Tax=Trichlorobacter ammonificans TaxID=2916410 RepID=A0ABM9D5B0_9BACT|nr:protein of unknown function [Trichlorobacter ammonificans]
MDYIGFLLEIEFRLRQSDYIVKGLKKFFYHFKYSFAFALISRYKMGNVSTEIPDIKTNNSAHSSILLPTT